MNIFIILLDPYSGAPPVQADSSAATPQADHLRTSFSVVNSGLARLYALYKTSSGKELSASADFLAVEKLRVV
jgi:hypothetical protein